MAVTEKAVTLKRAARLMECTRIEDDCLHDFWRSRNTAITGNAAVINNIPNVTKEK
jgi:hypothetical protein